MSNVVNHSKLVVVTRPGERGKALLQTLTTKNYQAFHIPLFDYQALKPENLSTVKDALEEISAVIVLSPAAVQLGLPLLSAEKEQLIKQEWFPIGPSTADALCVYDFPNIQEPYLKPYNSENLLMHPKLQAVTKQHILIMRGAGGVQSIDEALLAQGNKVSSLEVYQRCYPEKGVHLERLSQALQQHGIFLITCTTSVDNLIIMCNTNGLDLDKECTPLLVVSKRIAMHAKELGFKQLIVANGAETQEILKSLQQQIGIKVHG